MVLGLAAAYTPTPYTLTAPGRIIPASSILTIHHDKLYPTTGNFLMVTILTEPATVLYCLYGMLDPAASLTRDSDGDGLQHAQSPSELGQMELSQYFSTRVALETLGFEVTGKCLGLRVLSVLPTSPNHEKLLIGDRIEEVNGQTVTSVLHFKSLINKQLESKDMKASLVVERDGQRTTLVLPLTEVDGEARVGAILRPEFNSVELPVKVDFSNGNTIGASGGLVFALEIYDQLTAVSLSKGRTIAATGTLDGQGRVGPIGGLPFKLIAAERSGASIFLVPRENWPEIENIPTEMTVVPVKTFQEALHALE